MTINKRLTPGLSLPPEGSWRKIWVKNGKSVGSFLCTYFEIAARPLLTHGWITTQKEICWNPWKCNWADKESVCGFAHSNFLNILEISRNQGGSGKISKGNKELNLISWNWIHLLWSCILSDLNTVWSKFSFSSYYSSFALNLTSLRFCDVKRCWTSGGYFLLKKQSLIMLMFCVVFSQSNWVFTEDPGLLFTKG